jgi:purine-binding chemotaxis protein CheW
MDTVESSLAGMSAADCAVAEAVMASTIAAAVGAELFGTFLLQGEEFALPAAAIREVVNYPDTVTTIPLSPACLEGFFTLRGMAIPILNLARIFDPAAGAAQPSQKIAILDHDDVQVGLVFDATGEVLRVHPEQRGVVTCRNGAVAPLVCGTILLPNHARLLQILNAAALISVENVPYVRSMVAVTRAAERERLLRRASALKCICFSAGGTAFALPMDAVQEIIAVPDLRDSVMLGALCKGWFQHRGKAVGVIEFSALMGCAATGAATDARRLLIVRIGAELLGFLVDSVDTILSYYEADVLPIPMLGSKRGAMYRGCLARPTGPAVLFLDSASIFTDAELTELCAGHQRLYQAEAAEAGPGAKAAQRETWLAFTLDCDWVIDIRQVLEIVPFSATLARPPGTHSCVHGLMNVRKKIVTVLDPRRLYQLPQADDAVEERRILVVERDGERYGLVVDRVDSILTLCAAARRPSPRLLRINGNPTDLRADVAEVVEIDAGGQRSVRSLFDCDAFFAKLAREDGVGA